jgi:hypothetical protein
MQNAKNTIYAQNFLDTAPSWNFEWLLNVIGENF